MIGLISVDDHVQEHPRVWTDRLSRARWGDRIPHVEQTDGIERWFVDGQPIPLPGVAAAGALTADRSDPVAHWADVPPAAYVPGERLRAMDAAGVDYSVLYPTVAGRAGETFGRITDPDLELACVQAYNDWLIEEWASASERFIPQCIVPIYPPERTVAEIERAVKMGHRGVVFPALPMELREVPHVNEPEYDPVWAACQELRVPLCLHAGAAQRLRFPVSDGLSPRLASALEAITRPVSAVFDVVNLLLSQVLVRFPDLNVVFAESALGWSTFLLEYGDHQFHEDHCEEDGYELAPSEMFLRQCFLTGWYDEAAPYVRHVGPRNLLWATNFPLATSTWPDTREYVERCFRGVSEEDRRQVLWENAAALYGVPLRVAPPLAG